MLYLALAFNPLIGYWYWGWWWWWWIAIVVIFIWLLFLPPFSYGSRWYGGYGGGTAPPPAAPPSGTTGANSSEWQSVENEYTRSPSTGVVEADRLVTPMVSGAAHPQVSDRYRHAHAVAERASRGEATEPELKTAMDEYRSIFRTLHPRGV